jgi:hypothetical protein
VIACRETDITRHWRVAAIIASRLRAGRPRNLSLIPSRSKRFFHSMLIPDRLYGCQMPFANGKAPGVEADHSIPLSAKVKYEWISASTEPYVRMACRETTTHFTLV